MRLLLHDYAGYPFPIPLSRELARRGHTVLHVSAGYNNTPHGELHREEDDPAGLEFQALYTRRPLNKYSFLRRWQQEREYGLLLAEAIRRWQPQVVISANTPLDAQAQALHASHAVGARFVFWLQDLLGEASWRILRRRIPLLGGWIGSYYRALEACLACRSEHVITISEDFTAHTAAWGVSPERVSLIPNWAPLEDLPEQPRLNTWSSQAFASGPLGFAEGIVFLYTGSLALKHNPGLLLELARDVQSLSARVMVISDGPGADWLSQQAHQTGLSNLQVLPYQPYARLAQVLAAADVLVAVLEADAGVFSVPSKVLGYLCAGRPLLLAVPAANQAARLVQQAQAGLVVAPGDTAGFLAAARTLAADARLCEALGLAGRAYAESHFAIAPIADQFESLILQS